MADSQRAPGSGGIGPRGVLGIGSRGAAAVVLLVLAVFCFVLYRIDNGREHHSYNGGGNPPANVALTKNKQYEISTPGGMAALIAGGGQADQLNCNYTPVSGTETRQLTITALGTDTRTTHAVATFIAPVSGLVRIECRGLSATYVDDADNTPFDSAGLFMLLGTIALTVGSALGLSALYWRSSGRDGADGPAAGEPDDVLGDATARYGTLLAPPGEGSPTR